MVRAVPVRSAPRAPHPAGSRERRERMRRRHAPPPHPSCHPQLAAGYCAATAVAPSACADTAPAGMPLVRVENACETDLPAASWTFALFPYGVVTDTFAGSVLTLLTV